MSIFKAAGRLPLRLGLAKVFCYELGRARVAS